MKRFALFIAICISSALIPLPTVAQSAEHPTSGKCGDNLSWVFDGVSTLTVSGQGSMYDYVNGVSDPGWVAFYDRISSVIVKEGVTGIGCQAFYLYPNLSSIQLPTSLSSIGGYAFYGDRLLQEVFLPESLEYVGAYAFDGTMFLFSLPDGDVYLGRTYYLHKGDLSPGSEVVIRPGTMYIADEAFAIFDDDGRIIPNVNLSSVSLPESLVGIGDLAFVACSGLSSLSIPANVSFIGKNAFNMNGAGGLSSVVMMGAAPPEIYDNSFSAGISFTLPDGAYDSYCADPVWKNMLSDVAEGRCGDNLFWSINKADGSMTVSGSGCMIDFSSYGDIPWNSFYSDIKSLVVESGVTSIGMNAFAELPNLTSVSLPEGLMSIGKDAFLYCEALSSVSMPASVDRVSYGAFSYTPFLNSLPDGVVRFGATAYSYKGDMPASYDLVIDDGVKYINDNFLGVIVDLEGNYRDNTNLKSLSLPSSLVEIGREAFTSCSGLVSISIPAGVRSIGYAAFALCSALNYVYMLASAPPSISMNSFPDNSAPVSVLVRRGLVDVFSSADGWREALNAGYIAIAESDGTAVGIEDADNMLSPMIWVSADGRILVSPDAVGVPYIICNINGAVVSQGIVSDPKGLALSISALPSGIYMIRVAEQIIKFVL